MTSIYLVRHGDYNYRDTAPETVGQGLTARGRQQARVTATWLADTDSGIRSIRSSTFTRASETASILASSLPLASLEVDPQLRECQDVYFKDTPRVPQTAEEAFDLLFGTAASHSYPVVVVCHANLIRYLLSRLLAWTRRKWESVSIGNCSVSIVELSSDPEPDWRVHAVANVDHLPPDLRDKF